MGNVAMLGGCVRLLLPEGLGYLERAIASRIGATAVANIAAAREGFAGCTRQHVLAGDASIEPVPDAEQVTPHPAVFAIDDRLARQPHRLLVVRTPASSRTRARPAPSARSSARKARSRGRTARWSSTISTARAAASARVVCPVRNAVELEGVAA